METSSRVCAAVLDATKLLSAQLARHGVCDVLIQDLLHSAAAWLPASGTAALKKLLVPSASVMSPPDLSLELPRLELPRLQLTGAELDAAFATLRMLNKRVAALSHMAHQPSSCSSAQGVSVNAQSWLVAHKAVQLRHFWQYGYSITFRNTAEEPLQLLKKAWTVCDITGSSRHRESTGLCGLQPVIEPSGSLSCKTAITLSSVKGSMQGSFVLRGLDSGEIFKATVPAFALTPSALQLNDPATAVTISC